MWRGELEEVDDADEVINVTSSSVHMMEEEKDTRDIDVESASMSPDPDHDVPPQAAHSLHHHYNNVCDKDRSTAQVGRRCRPPMSWVLRDKTITLA